MLSDTWRRLYKSCHAPSIIEHNYTRAFANPRRSREESTEGMIWCSSSPVQPQRVCTLHFELALLFTNISSHSIYILHIYDSGCNVRGDKETILNLKSTILVIHSLFVEKKQSSFTGAFHFPKTHNNDLFRIFLLYLFKISLVPDGVPHIWKSAFVLPLFKGGDPTEKLSASLQTVRFK